MIGGGVGAFNNLGYGTVVESYPATDSSWRGTVRASGGTLYFTVYAICARLE